MSINKAVEQGQWQGLSEAEVLRSEQQFGRNVFLRGYHRTPLSTIWGIVSEPMFILLLFTCLLYFIAGEPEEGILMLSAMVFVAAISFYQEVRSDHALEALDKYTEPMVTVIREGKRTLIGSAALVPGDWLVLSEGDLITADAKLVQSNDLTVDESVITGESLPVEKGSREGDERVFQGSTVNSGSGLAIVTATANATELGKLGKSMDLPAAAATPLEHSVSRLVRIMAMIGGIVFLIIWLVDYQYTKNVMQGLLPALTLAMSIIPEEIPVAFSSFMALGAFRMSKGGMIVRRPQTVENLGAVSVICLDKTGTITENRMRLAMVYDQNTDQLVTELSALTDLKVILYGRLASETIPFDSMEKAIGEVYDRSAWALGDYPRMIHEYPLEGRPPMMTHVYRSPVGTIVAGKGAPERILQVCRLDQTAGRRLAKYAQDMARKGFRVLGVCSAATNESYPAEQDNFAWHFEGLLAFYDPPRTGLVREFDRWKTAGISIRLLTGDFRETSETIAREAGIPIVGTVLTGEDIMRYDDAGLRQAVKQSSLFVRMYPEAKLRVVNALKADGAVVAMIGDGVNDGPAIRTSDIGISLGSKGTQIARQASDLVLTDDDISKVYDAIREGRKIYDNIKKAIRYILSIHLPIILTASLPLFLNWSVLTIFTPVHVIFLELVMGPTCSIFFENEPVGADLMRRSPRRSTHTLFSVAELLWSLVQGLVIAIGLLAIYYHYMAAGASVNYIRSMVFITLVIANISLTFASRSYSETIIKTVHYKNDLAKYVLLGSCILLLCFMFLPPVHRLFGLVWLGWAHYGICLAVAVITTLWTEPVKSRQKRQALLRQ